MLLDVLKIGGDCGLPIGTYRYVGLGANRFYDFILLHKYLGIKEMVSIEHDSQMFSRALFNVPFGFIDVRKTTVAEFLESDGSDRPTIYWWDYDTGLEPEILETITSLSVILKTGDYCFITVAAGPPGPLAQNSTAQRFASLRESYPQVTVDVMQEDVEDATFQIAVHKILIASFSSAFSIRNDGIFVPLFQVEYQDSVRMLTVGGAFLDDEQANCYRRKMSLAMPFLKNTPAALYFIRSLNLTERERALFDRAVTSKRKNTSERNALIRIGFGDKELVAYEELIRYLPRYVETLL